MAITKNYNRQCLAMAVVMISLADIVDGGAVQPAVELPDGAIVTGGSVLVTEVFNAATTATLDLGDAADEDRYTATPLDLKTLGAKALIPSGYVMPNKGDILATYASTGAAATTGALTLVVEYIDIQKSEWTQG